MRKSREVRVRVFACVVCVSEKQTRKEELRKKKTCVCFCFVLPFCDDAGL